MKMTEEQSVRITRLARLVKNLTASEQVAVHRMISTVPAVDIGSENLSVFASYGVQRRLGQKFKPATIAACLLAIPVGHGESADWNVVVGLVTACKAERKVEDYKAIAAWGAYLRSFAAYVKGEQRRALSAFAPLDAVYQNDDGTWVTVGDVKSREALAFLKERLG